MLPYRVFIKDSLNLSSKAKGMVRCLSFDVGRDLLSEATSSFEVLEIPEGTCEGDMLGLVDPFGVIIYQGVVIRMEEQMIETNQIEALFEDNWIYRVPGYETIEESVINIIDLDFKKNSDPIMQKKYSFELRQGSSTVNGFPTKQEHTVENFKNFLYGLFDTYGIRCFFDIPFTEGIPGIEVAKKEYVPLKVGDNANMIRNLAVTTEVKETNKLVIYSKEGILRKIYYGTSKGISEDKTDLNRIQRIKTKFIFSDDEIDTVLADNLSENMYNHKITFDLILKNKIYDFKQIKLGQPIQIWEKGKCYDSILTGYELHREENKELEKVSMTCGKVRVDLDKKILNLIKQTESASASTASTNTGSGEINVEALTVADIEQIIKEVG